MPSDQFVFILADDDSDDWEIFQEGLQEIVPPHILHWVKHGDEILPAVREIKPHILFLDLNLPGGYTGIDWLRMIKEDSSLRDMPVVIYTTSNAMDQVKECYSLGASRYLLKPVNYSGIFRGLDLIFRLYQTDKLINTVFDEFVIDTYKLK